MLNGKSKVTALKGKSMMNTGTGKDVTKIKGKSMMNTGTGKDVTKIKVKDRGANMPAGNQKMQSVKARNKK